MIEVSDLYRTTLDFNKEIVFEKDDVIICEDFVLMNVFDSGILKEIERGNSLSDLKNTIGLDTLDYMHDRLKGIPIIDLLMMTSDMSLPSTFFLHTFYNEFTIFAEVRFIESTWNEGKILKELVDSDWYGFSISYVHAKVNLFTFKCDEKGQMKYIRKDTYATFH